METIENRTMMNYKETAVKMALDRWYTQIKNFDTTLGELSDETLYKRIAPNKNRGIYVLGHLIAIHEDMVPLLNFGEKMYPELRDLFITAPDNEKTEMPSASDLRTYWKNVNNTLESKMKGLSADDWFERHSVVSPEDFAKEPHRNKLNIIITRTSHLSYHLGQFNLLK
jgi:hypothetical protein